jgi:GT2 family glycosyltransferase
VTTRRASVVIPTFRRKRSLLRALNALATQTIAPDEYEVIVVIDGSDDGSREAVESLSPAHDLRVLWQGKRGRAAACNTGVAVAQGELIVLLDDDMEATPGFLEAHLRAHPPGSRIAVIGAAPVSITPELPPHVKYIGEKFNAHLERLARAGGPLKLRDFYSGNFSIRRELFDAVHGFDERFTVYGNEDLELSIRLTAAGVRLVYEPSAIAMQSYDKDFDGLARDNVAKGRTAVLLARLHPSAREELKLGTFRRERLTQRLAVGVMLVVTGLFPAMREINVRAVRWLGDRRVPGVERLYPVMLDYLYWCGVREAEHEEPTPVRT